MQAMLKHLNSMMMTKQLHSSRPPQVMQDTGIQNAHSTHACMMSVTMVMQTYQYQLYARNDLGSS